MKLGFWKSGSPAKWALLCVSVLISCSSDDSGRADEQSLVGGELTPAPAVFGPSVENGLGGAPQSTPTNFGDPSAVSVFGDDSVEQRVDPPRTVSQYCGDGAYDPEIEECDDGVGNALDTCTQDCQTRDLLAVPATDVGAELSRKMGLGRHPISGGPLGSALTWVDVSADPKVVVQLRDVYGHRASSESPEVVIADANGADADETRPVIDSNPVIATLPDGTHVVAYNDLNGDGNELGVALRSVSHLTGTLGDVQYANTTNIGAQHDADLLWTDEGLIAAWVDTSDPLNGPDIRYRIYDESLSATTNELTLAASYQPEAAVTLSRATGSASWAAAWKRGEAGSNEDAHEAIVVSHGGQQIAFTPRVQLVGDDLVPSAELGGGMGGADPGYARMMPGHIDDRIGLAPLGEDLFAVAFTVGTDPENTGVANVFRVWIAVVDFVAEGVVWIDEVSGPEAHDETYRQRSPALVDASLTGAAGSVFLAWREDSALNSGNGQDLWLKRLDWDANTNSLVTPEPADPQDPIVPLVPLVRNETSVSGNQRQAALANVFVPGGRALSIAWEDWGRNFDTEDASQARPDIAVQVAPIPLRRGEPKRLNCSPLEPCESGQGHCENDDDCVGGTVCASRRGPWHGYGPATNICEPAHCSDGERSAGEAGIDCGGACGPCFECLDGDAALGTAHYCSAVCPCSSTEGDCDSDFDCVDSQGTGSGDVLSCVENVGDRIGLPAPIDICLTGECNDGVRNGDELGIDCGGPDCPSCSAGSTLCADTGCGVGQGHCTSDDDCASGAGLVCAEGQGVYYGLPAGTAACVPTVCLERPAHFDPAACTPECPCGSGGGVCGADTDCLDGAEYGVSCIASRGIYFGLEPHESVCVSDQCFNGIRDANEVQVDCGGPCGSECSVCNGDPAVLNFEHPAELWDVEPSGTSTLSVSNAPPVHHGSGSLDLSGCGEQVTLLSAPFAADAFDVLGDEFYLDFALPTWPDPTGLEGLVVGSVDVALRHGNDKFDLIEVELYADGPGTITRLAAPLPTQLRELLPTAASGLQAEVTVKLPCAMTGATAFPFIRLDHMQLGGEEQVFRSACSPSGGAITTDADLLGFENLSLWPDSGLATNDTDVRQGAASAERSAGSHTITSSPFALGYGTPNRLLLDVKLDAASGGANLTTTLSCPSRGVHTVHSETISSSLADEWVAVPFHLLDSEVAKLDNPASDCTISIQTTANAGGGTVLYDDLRFVAPGHCTDYQQIDGANAGGTEFFAVGMSPVQDGDPARPFRVCTPGQFQTLFERDDWDAHIYLEADIDLDGVTGQLGDNGVQHFRGLFDGNGHSLSNYSFSGGNRAGLFAVLYGDGLIRNVTLRDPTVVGVAEVGSLVGLAAGGEVRDVYSVGGSVSATGSGVGSLIGVAQQQCEVVGAHASTLVSADGNDVGGLVGRLNGSTIEMSSSSAAVSAVSGWRVGGLAGYVTGQSSVERSSSSGSVSTGGIQAGGLVGLLQGVGAGIVASSSSATVDGQSSVGGLVAHASNGTNVLASHATGDVMATANGAGGLVGTFNGGTIEDCSATGDVESGTLAGGLIGSIQGDGGTISRAWASGDVEARDHVGGLIGWCYNANVSDAFSSGAVTSTNFAAGGLIGSYRVCTVERSHSVSTVSGSSPLSTVASADYDTLGNPDPVIDTTFADTFGLLTGNEGLEPISATPGHPGGTNLTVDEFTDPSHFTNFDFFTTWEMGENYPTLRRGWCQLYDQPDDFSTVVGRYVPNGDADRPFVLCNSDQFQWFVDHSEYWDENLVLGSDINLTSVLGYIGEQSGHFVGTFDGAGHTLSHYRLERPTNDLVGLFSDISSTGPEDGHLDGVIKNLLLEDFEVTGNSLVGTLVGRNRGTVRDVVVRNSRLLVFSDATTGAAGGNGGVVGQNYFATMTRVSVEDIDVSCGESSCGGVVGQNYNGSIDDCHARTGVVRGGAGGSFRGGLAGHTVGPIDGSSSAVFVDAGASGYVGGIAGGAAGGETSRVSGCLNSGTVHGGTFVGGIVGLLTTSTSVAEARNEGTVVGVTQTGGVAGQASAAEVVNSSSSGRIESSTSVAGGLVGFVGSGTLIEGGLATGEVFSPQLAGGLVGQLGSAGTSVRHSAAEGAVFGTTYIGGLVGLSYIGASVTDSMASGDVYGEGSLVGGAFGQVRQGASVSNCEARGDVVGLVHRAGAFAGEISDATVLDSSALGDVRGAADVGGFTGRTSASAVVRRCDARGYASGVSNVGGFVGYALSGDVLEDVQAYGDVSGTNNVGGVAGRADYASLREAQGFGSARATGSYAGGLLGFGRGVVIEDSRALGRAEAVAYAGGLVGRAYTSSSILRSFASGVATATGSAAGGLVAWIQDSTVLDSYATGSASANTWAGGLFGTASGTSIQNAYAYGAVSANTTNYGTVIGFDGGTNSLTSVYGHSGADPEVNLDVDPTPNDAATNAAVTHLDAHGYLEQSNFIGWDFDNTWQMGLGGPTLRSGYCIKTEQLDNFPFAVVPEGEPVPDGTAEAPYVLCNANQLATVMASTTATELGSYFRLGQNIDVSALDGQIGNPATNVAFTGTFDGQGFSLINYAPTSGGNHKGLFYRVVGDGDIDGTSDGHILDLNLISPIVSGGQYVGALAGEVDGGLIERVTVTDADVDGTGTHTGGLIGRLTGAASAVRESTVSADVDGTDHVGGLVGSATDGALVEESRSSGTVDGSGAPGDHVGGLVGSFNSATLWDSHSSSVVNANGDYVGGLIGLAENSALALCSATGTVGATSALNYVGGLIGHSSHTSIARCWATGDVDATGSPVGGLLGSADDGIVSDSYAAGDVDGVNQVGGLIGHADGTSITRVYAKGSVTGTSGQGALIGEATSDVYLAASFGAASAGHPLVGNQSGAGATLIADSDFGDWNTFASEGWEFGTIWRSGSEGPTLGGGAGDLSDEPCLRYAHDNTLGGTFLKGMPVDPDGSAANPWPLCSAAHIQRVIDDSTLWGHHFELHADVNLESVTGQIAAAGDFTGVFEGNGHRLIGYSHTGTQLVGLFRSIGSAAVVRNVELEDFVVSGESYVGALAGQSLGTIENISLSGVSATSSDLYLGGLIGVNDGEVRDVSASGIDVDCTAEGCGGLFGATAENSSLTNIQIVSGVVLSSAGTVGGLAGYGDGSFTGCSSAAVVNTATGSAVGGLVGTALGTITGSVASGDVTGVNGVGGLVGATLGAARVFSSSASGAVTGQQLCGGLVGQLGIDGRLFDSFATGTSDGDSVVGGLVGYAEIGGNTVVERVWASGDVTVDTSQAGGLIGYAGDVVIADALALGAVSGGIYIGGLVGQADAALVTRSLALGAASGTSEVGAIVGDADSETHFFGTLGSQSANGSFPLLGNSSGEIVGTMFATDARLADAQTFISQGWDLTDVWALEGTTPTLVDREGEIPYCERYEQQVTWPMQLPFSIGADEDGSAAKPYRICTPLQFLQLSYEPEWLGHNFVLASHLDLSTVTRYTGSFDDPFTGTLDGDGHVLYDFTHPNEALFQLVEGDGFINGDQDGRLLNLNLARFAVSSPYDDLGGLVGHLSNGSVENVHARGMSVTGSNIANIGGLVGENSGRITNVSFEGQVTGNSSSSIGGVVGATTGAVQAAESFGDVSGDGDNGLDSYVNVGGVVGWAQGSLISGCTSHSDIFLTRGRRAGGIIGAAIDESTVHDCHAHGAVVGDGDAQRIGGLAGTIVSSAVSRSSAHGDVTAGRVVGGLVGELTDSTLTESFAEGDATSIRTVRADGTLVDGSYAGGLIGYIDVEGSDIYRSFATGDAEGHGYIGGLIGCARGRDVSPHTIQDSYATGTVRGDLNYIGGLIGFVEHFSVERAVSSGVVVDGPTTATGSHIGAASAVYVPEFADNFTVSTHAPGMVRIGNSSSSGVSDIDLTTYQDPGVIAAIGWDAAWETKSFGPVLLWAEVEEGWCGTHGQTNSAPFATGVTPLPDGTAENPYRLCNADQVMALMNTVEGDGLLDKHYLLEADIDLSGINPTPADVRRIGSWTDEFAGDFDGNGHVLSGYSLHMTTPEAGMFGSITGRVANLLLVGVDVSSTSRNVGALTAAVKSGGAVDHVIVSGGLVHGEDDDTGAVVGDLKDGGIVSNTVGAVDVTSMDADDTGGLIGVVEGTVVDCEARGDVLAAGVSSRAGGLVGLCINGCSITFSVARGAVSSPGQRVGGFVGTAEGGASLARCEAHGTATGHDRTGGFVGQLHGGATITECAAHGDVSSTETFIGGFVGNSSSTAGPVTRSFATGDVHGNDYVGGFSGFTGSLVEDCFATGAVSATYRRLGGFSGRSKESTIRRSYSFGTVSTSISNEVGDFMGSNENNTFTSCLARNQSHSTFGVTVAGSTSGVSAVSTSSFANSATFSGWDFSTVWRVDADDGRPVLRWAE